MVVGECMPIPDPKFLVSILRELGGIEGYIAAKSAAVAVFSSKFEGGKVQVQKNMHNAFKEGEAVFVIVMTQRPSTEKPVHPAIIEAQRSGALRGLRGATMTVEDLRDITKAVVEYPKTPKNAKDKLEFILGFLDGIIEGKDLGQIRGFEEKD